MPHNGAEITHNFLIPYNDNDPTREKETASLDTIAETNLKSCHRGVPKRSWILGLLLLALGLGIGRGVGIGRSKRSSHRVRLDSSADSANLAKELRRASQIPQFLRALSMVYAMTPPSQQSQHLMEQGMISSKIRTAPCGRHKSRRLHRHGLLL